MRGQPGLSGLCSPDCGGSARLSMAARRQDAFDSPVDEWLIAQTLAEINPRAWTRAHSSLPPIPHSASVPHLPLPHTPTPFIEPVLRPKTRSAVRNTCHVYDDVRREIRRDPHHLLRPQPTHFSNSRVRRSLWLFQPKTGIVPLCHVLVVSKRPTKISSIEVSNKFQGRC